jgi:hypothetical protein
VIAVAVSLCRIYHWCKDAFPTSRLKGDGQRMFGAKRVKRQGAFLTYLSNPKIPNWKVSFPPRLFISLTCIFQFPDSGMKLFLDTTKRIADAVEVYYDFDASRSSVSRNRNANLASKLLRGRSFVYIVCSSFFFFFFEPIYIPEYKPETKPGRSYEPLHLETKVN